MKISLFLVAVTVLFAAGTPAIADNDVAMLLQLTEIRRLVDVIAKVVSGDRAGHATENHVSPVYHQSQPRRHCWDLFKLHNLTRSGVYEIKPDASKPVFQVFCNMETSGGGWTVFQRRQDGSQSFNKNWDEYSKGFGDLKKEHWLGNEKVHMLTATGGMELRVDIEECRSPNYEFQLYDNFRVGPEAEDYPVRFGRSHGTAGDPFGCLKLNGSRFATWDHDNSQKCASTYSGGFWYASFNRTEEEDGTYWAHKVQPLLNARFHSVNKMTGECKPAGRGFQWYADRDSYPNELRCNDVRSIDLQGSEMKIRPAGVIPAKSRTKSS